MTKSFYIHTLGCRVNQSQSDELVLKLVAAGYKHVLSPEDADICFVNTCTVTGEADAKSRKTVRSLKRKCSGDIYVLGCSVNMNKQLYEELGACTSLDSLPLVHEYPLINEHAYLRCRRSIVIQNGCDNACSYCIVHTARGPARSVAADEIITKARTLSENGIKEIVLTGIDLGAWQGSESTPQLSDLLKRLLSQTQETRFRLSSIEPTNINEELINLLAQSNGRLCRYLHIPLQSGSSKVLKEMNRHYDAEKFIVLIERVRNACPNIALSTDIIVGFPGETEHDFNETYALAQQARFMKLHIFRYSKRAGTPAAERKDQIAPETKAQRAKALTQLNSNLAKQDLDVRAGNIEDVIIERKEQNLCTGTSESFHTLQFNSQKPVGSLEKVML